MKTLLLISIFLAGMSAGAQGLNACTSATVTERCLEITAALNVDFTNSTFTFHKFYTPVCPFWPPYRPPIQGKIESVGNEGGLELLTAEGLSMGQLSYDLQTGTYSGEIGNSKFSQCHF